MKGNWGALVALLALGCSLFDSGDAEPGLPLELAELRSSSIRDVEYDIEFRIPELKSEPVTGKVTVSFASNADLPLFLDFRGDTGSLGDVVLNGRSTDAVSIRQGHIIVGAQLLDTNQLSMSFASADDALNRQDDFMYALFVPDRAATAFPSFDQPDIKARYRLTLDVPLGWSAVANGEEQQVDTLGNRVRIQFAETAPISTYLFSFAAGKFQREDAVRDGRTLTMFHRETDLAKVARNREAIFDLHAAALRWLESYTNIPYPFGKFAFLAVPSFQFGGMEHPGAVWYRASSLFLDESATQSQYLGRASVIAHETAHMWFGDLVTMRWFNDVWMKEVFANFMAAKIVEPSFPDVNHRLRFFLAHHPSAYGVDRTAGPNAIRQDLENLRQAGSLYGAIIYQKAPIVMRQLEQLVGDSVFRDAMREYLAKYQFGNATWRELVDILDAKSPLDIAAWSRAWVEEAGRPRITTSWSNGQLIVRQSDPHGARQRAVRKLRWEQSIGILSSTGGAMRVDTVRLSGDSARASMPQRPTWVVAGVDGVSYGHMVLDSASAAALLADVSSIEDPIHRATALYALWESVLDGDTAPLDFFYMLLRVVPSEREDLIASQLLGMLRTTYWRFLPSDARLAQAQPVEEMLWQTLQQVVGTSRRSALWSAYQSVAQTPDAVARLRRVWSQQESVPGVPLGEPQYTSLAEQLAVRGVADADSILDAQFTRIENPDRRDRFQFVRPALSANASVRDSVFASFAHVDNRRRESWVLDAMRYLNHPLRAANAEHYIVPGLDLADDIQRTGDIFFPLNWMNALLDGHQSPAAADSVTAFLERNRNMQFRLRGKLLQAADELFRAARLVHGHADTR